MSLQADIAWVQQEVEKVNNPHLIEALKAILLYRKDKVNDSTESSSPNDWVKNRLTEAALASEEDIKAGRIHTIEEAKEYLAKRRKSLIQGKNHQK